FYTPHLAPGDSTIFDYTTPDGRTLFSVQPIPPSQGDAKLAALHGTAGRAGTALAAALLFLFMVAPPGPWRWVVVLAAAWCLLRAPLGLALGLASSFSPALFYRPMLGVFSASAGPRGVPGTLPAACAWAVRAALAGLRLWQPYGAWPEWYTFVWLPALVGVMVPAPSRWAVCGIATVAGTAAALVTWGAAVEGRLGLAERDAAGLGREDDAPAVVLLERMAHELPTPEPRTAGELYAFWLKSPLAAEDYPATLAVWTRARSEERTPELQ